MPKTVFPCPQCKTDLEVEPGTSDLTAICPSCRSSLTAHFFPAFFRPVAQGMTASSVTDHNEASCFYHPQKQALRVCDGCGRLICSLCSIDMGTEHLCPACISSGKKKGKIVTLENSRTRYDSIALSLAIFGLLTSFLSIILAPAAIYVAIRYWSTPNSILGGGRGRYIAAIIIAVLSLLVWGGIFGLAIFGAARTHLHHHA